MFRIWFDLVQFKLTATADANVWRILVTELIFSLSHHLTTVTSKQTFGRPTQPSNEHYITHVTSCLTVKKSESEID